MRKKNCLWALVICVMISVPPLLAAVVTDVEPDGTMTLQDGKRVALAGVRMDEEGARILKVLAKGQDVRVELILGSQSGGKESAYVYLQSKFLKFPWKPSSNPEEREIFLNEFLVQLGAAKVAEDHDFGHNAQFLKVQDEARQKGEGIWSYQFS